MNLQCPNCQKLLTVQEHYAGQLMKCPLCKENFTVPALPSGMGMEPAPAFSAPTAPPSSPPPGPEAYGLKAEPEPAPAFQGFGVTAPPPIASAPEPAFSIGTAPAPAPSSTSTTKNGPARPPAPPPPAGYTQTFTIWISEKVLQWVPPAALILVFVLQLPIFSWVGIYPGGVEAVSQGAWGAAFGATSEDPDMKDVFQYKSDKDRPGMSPLLFLYMPLSLLALAATVGVAALPYIKAPLPPQVQQILPWKWAIVAGLNALLLLFLGMQMLLGFSIENSYKAWIDEQPSVRKEGANTVEKKTSEARRGQLLDALQRTLWLKLVVLLHILATAAAALVYWIEKRGPAQPLPRIELMW